MGYRRTLLLRWSRRDRLAVVVVGVTVAFLTGATLLLLAAGAQTAGIAGEFDSPGSITHVEEPPETLGPNEVFLPTATVQSNRTTADARIVGVPDGATISADRPLRAGSGTGTTLGTLDRAQAARLSGEDGDIEASISPRGASVFPPSWYVSDPGTVRAVGGAGGFILDTDPATTPDRGVPLLGALVFFLLGTQEALGALVATAVGAALLVGVTVYSVSRMGVRDRLGTIRIIRATGGTPGSVLGVFAARATLLTVVGVAFGYAVGVVVANAAVNVAVAVGLPTALPIGVTERAIQVLLPLYGGIAVIGLVTGALAAYPAATRPPGLITEHGTARGARVPDVLSLQLLDWRALVPTTATLTAFVAFVLLVAGLAGAAGPLVASDDTTITEPGSKHPVSSKVPEAYADVLRERGVGASAEILLFEAIDGRAVPARGAAFGPFANVTDARLTAGRPHADPGEVVVGADLAETLELAVGDEVTLGGSTRSGLTRVEVVGLYEAPGPQDDQLLVTLETARHLSGVSAGTVQFVRSESLSSLGSGAADPREAVEVVDIEVVGQGVAGEPLRVRVAVRNFGLTEATVPVDITYRGETTQRSVVVPQTATRTVEATFAAGEPGSYELRAGEQNRTVTVRPPDALSLEVGPAQIPPGGEPLVRVTDATGAGVPNATISVGNQTRRTRDDGRVRVPPLEAGQYTVNVTAGNRRTSAALDIVAGAERQLVVSLGLQPTQPSQLDEPTLRVNVTNPWDQPLSRELSVVGPATETRESVRVEPGARRQVRVRLPRRPPGSYTVTVSANGTAVTSTEYGVSGDDRLVAALASSGRSGSSGIGQAIEVAFGNLQVVLGALLGLAALMTVGGTTAAFAQTVHARRRTLGIYRATGAAPSRVLGFVIRDATLVGTVAAVLAAVLAQAGMLALGELGYLTAFGIRLEPTLGPLGLVATVLGGVALTVVSAALATAGLLVAAPSQLLSPSEAPTGSPTGDSGSRTTERHTRAVGGADDD